MHTALSAQHEEVSTAHSLVSTAHEQTNQVYQSLSESHAELTQAHAELQATHADTHKARGELQAERDALRTNLQETESALEKLQVEHSEVSGDLEKVSTDHKALTAAHEQITQQHEELSNKHTSLATQHEALSAEHTERVEELKNTHGHLAHEKSASTDWQVECERLEAQVQVLEQKLTFSQKQESGLEGVKVTHEEELTTVEVSLRFSNMTMAEWEENKDLYDQSFLRGLSRSLKEPIECIGEITTEAGSVIASAKVVTQKPASAVADTMAAAEGSLFAGLPLANQPFDPPKCEQGEPILFLVEDSVEFQGEASLLWQHAEVTTVGLL